MLKKITFLKDHRCFKKGDTFDFEPLTLLVGDQGCGKSTILQLLSSAGTKQTGKIVKITAGRIDTRTFDYEKNNPRMSHYVETTFDVVTRLASHGQFVKALNKSMTEQEGVCWLQDEPDSALSIRSCLDLAKHIKIALTKGCQVVASIHSPIVMEQFDKVYSLEHRKWMRPQEFIKWHMTTELGVAGPADRRRA
jgi:predicted ATPase